MNRRAFLAGLAASGLASSRVFAAPLDDINFTVRIAGDRVGHHRLMFDQAGDDLTVSVDVRIKVRVLFVTVFDYRQTVTEHWRGARLIRLQSETIDGDNHDQVTAVAREGGLEIESRRFGARRLAGDLWPTTAFWRPASVRRDSFLDAAKGTVRPVTISAAGQEQIETPAGNRLANRYHVDTSRDFDVWYGLDGDWLALSWSGFGVTANYRRI